MAGWGGGVIVEQALARGGAIAQVFVETAEIKSKEKSDPPFARIKTANSRPPKS